MALMPVKVFAQKGILLQPAVHRILSSLPTVALEQVAEIIAGFGLQTVTSEQLLGKLPKITHILQNLSENESDKTKQATLNKALLILTNFAKEKKEKSEPEQKPMPETRQEQPVQAKPVQAITAITTAEKKKEQLSFNGVEILRSYDLPSRKFGVDDFVKYFRERFNLLRRALTEHNNLPNLTSINKLSKQRQNDISILGLVNEKRLTKNKNLLLEIEDLTGKARVLVHQSKSELLAQAQYLVLDEAVGLRCSGNNEFLFANEIVWPDAITAQKRSPRDEYAAFISDIHIGSTNFIEDKFLAFIDWLNLKRGSASQRSIAKKVKYLFVVGDSVDGVGIFPGQEELLNIKDIRQQYDKLAELLGKIRADVKIILSPGQHDSVRVAEPQPPLDDFYAASLHKISNLILVSNPALVRIGAEGNFPGFKVLMYHGASFHSLIDNIEELRLKRAHDTPAEVVKQLLKKRHLSPQHGFSVYLPFAQDPLTISEIPDIVTTAEIHRADIATYNNIQIITSSCWQEKTPYEEKVGNNPEPCKVPVFNLKTGKVRILDFG